MKANEISKTIYQTRITNPLILFIITIVGMWIVYLLTSRVSYKFNQNYYTLNIVVILSIFFYAGSYMSLSSRYGTKPNIRIKINSNKVSFVTYYILIPIVLFIILLNMFYEGLPPFFKFMNYDVSSYMEYGRFKAFLTPTLNLVVLLSLLQSYKYRNIFIIICAILINILYLMRGPLIILIAQIIFLNISLSKPNKFNISYKLLIFLAIILFAMSILGEIRTGKVLFYSFMGIKQEYQYLNIGFLWIITYIGSAVSDLLTLIEHVDNIPKQYGLNLISNSLPSFVRPELSLTYLQHLNLIDGVFTYIGNILLDFGLFGIIFINVIYGAVFSILYYGIKYRENILIIPIYLSIIMLTCFFDYLFFIPSIIQIILSLVIFNYIHINHDDLTPEN